MSQTQVAAALADFNESGTPETTKYFTWRERSKRHETGVGIG